MALKSLKKIKEEVVCPPKVGEIVEGSIVGRGRSSIFLDLGPQGIGIIYGREFFNAKDQLKNLKEGTSVFTKVIGLETEDGYRELSFSDAHQELAWKELADARANEEIFEVVVKGANKGGLMCQLKGIHGFLPASQLLPEHYPKVKGAEPSRIAVELQKLVGQKIKVKVFDVSVNDKKLIFSEKATKKEKIEEELKKFEVGNVVDGEISGLTNFGAFLKFGQGLEGLIHSSEIPEKDKKENTLAIGKKVKAKIIEIVGSRIYLSLKNVK